MKLFASGQGLPLSIGVGVAAEVVSLKMAATAIDPAVIVSVAVALLTIFAAMLGLAKWGMRAVGREIMAEAKKDGDVLREQDRQAAAVLVEEAKEDAETLIHEAEVKAAEERERMHAQNLEGFAGLVKSVNAMSENVGKLIFSVYGDRSRGGVWDELNYAAEIRHQMIEHLQAVESFDHTLVDFLTGLATARDLKDIVERLKGCPRFIQPKAIERRRRRGDDHE